MSNLSFITFVFVDLLVTKSDKMFLPLSLLRLRHLFLRLFFLEGASCDDSAPQYAFLMISTTFVKTQSINAIILHSLRGKLHSTIQFKTILTYAEL